MFRRFGLTLVFLAAIEIVAFNPMEAQATLTLASGQSICAKIPPEYEGDFEMWSKELIDDIEAAKIDYAVQISTATSGVHQKTMESYLGNVATMFGAPPGTPITTAPPDNDDTPMIPFDNPGGDSPRGDVASGEGVASQAAATPTSESKPKGRKKSPDASA